MFVDVSERDVDFWKLVLRLFASLKSFARIGHWCDKLFCLYRINANRVGQLLSVSSLINLQYLSFKIRRRAERLLITDVNG